LAEVIISKYKNKETAFDGTYATYPMSFFFVRPITMKKTSGQSNLTLDHIAAANGWFNRIHQVEPVCTPSTWFLRPTRVL